MLTATSDPSDEALNPAGAKLYCQYEAKRKLFFAGRIRGTLRLRQRYTDKYATGCLPPSLNYFCEQVLGIVSFRYSIKHLKAQKGNGSCCTYSGISPASLLNAMTTIQVANQYPIGYFA